MAIEDERTHMARRFLWLAAVLALIAITALLLNPGEDVPPAVQILPTATRPLASAALTVQRMISMAIGSPSSFTYA
jgi:hypothetical protein